MLEATDHQVGSWPRCRWRRHGGDYFHGPVLVPAVPGDSLLLGGLGRKGQQVGGLDRWGAVRKPVRKAGRAIA